MTDQPEMQLYIQEELSPIYLGVSVKEGASGTRLAHAWYTPGTRLVHVWHTSGTYTSGTRLARAWYTPAHVSEIQVLQL
jgi:hypothetical protein